MNPIFSSFQMQSYNSTVSSLLRGATIDLMPKPIIPFSLFIRSITSSREKTLFILTESKPSPPISSLLSRRNFNALSSNCIFSDYPFYSSSRSGLTAMDANYINIPFQQSERNATPQRKRLPQRIYRACRRTCR